ncbi:MAG: hypothetical protein JRN52_10265 [Nitrososphaerota archaeon]|nr:hypothetical protein [Nitrososphaerota archaeon]
MRQKKRYLLLKSLPQDLPSSVKFLFQNEFGYVVKADLKTAQLLKADAILVSGCIQNVKHPQGLNRRKSHDNIGMK